MTASAKTSEHADEVAPARVETLMAGHAARRWILDVRLDRRVDEVFLARSWKKDIQSTFRKRDKNRRYGMRPSSNGPRRREAIKQLPTLCRLLTWNLIRRSMCVRFKD
jgi:hypothetical protein